MTDSRDALIEEIKEIFPDIKVPQDYANVVLEGIKLNAVDRDSSIKRRVFLASKIVKANAFVQSYSKYNLLIAIKNADRNNYVHTAREGAKYFVNDALRVLNLENKLLLQHVRTDHHVRTIVSKSLKLPTASISSIQNKLSTGDPFQRVSVYEKVFADLGKNSIPRKGYMWVGARTRPVSHYYLSLRTHNILKTCERR